VPSLPRTSPLSLFLLHPTVGADGLSFPQVPNVDPLTGLRDAAVPLKTLMATRRGLAPEVPGGACFGAHAVPCGNGVVRVGDVVRVLRWTDGDV
jgi:uncharacterized protein YcbX